MNSEIKTIMNLQRLQEMATRNGFELRYDVSEVLSIYTSKKPYVENCRIISFYTLVECLAFFCGYEQSLLELKELERVENHETS